MLAGKIIAFDCETTGLYPWLGDRPYAVSLCNEKGKTAYYEWPVDPFTREVVPPVEDLRELGDILSNPDTAKVGWNVKFDVRMLEMIGVPVRGKIHDAMFAAKICKADEINFKLKPLSEKYLDIGTEDLDVLREATIAVHRLAKKLYWVIYEAKNSNDNSVAADYWMCAALKRMHPEEAAILEEKFGVRLQSLVKKYCVQDSTRTMLMHLMYQTTLDTLGQRHVYEKEMKLWHVTYAMETRGVRVDMGMVNRGIKGCQQDIRKLWKVVHHKLGKEFNPASNPQKCRLLFGSKSIGGLGFQPIFLTPKGNPQVGAEVLDYYADKAPIIRTLMELAETEKAMAYYEQYKWMAVKDVHGEWIIHPVYNQIGTINARYSCTMPNLQNVPVRAESGRLAGVRGPFGPREGCVWLHLDYKQIEARIFAEIADEKDMLKAFRENRDVYDELVSRIKRIAKLVVKRQRAKNNFLGKLYGEGVKKLARAFGMEMDDAYRVVGAMEDAFPKLMPFMASTQKSVRMNGYIINQYARMIAVDPEFAYKGVNYWICSSAADLLKGAMLSLDEFLSKCGRDARMVMTIHDELVIEIRRAQLTTPFIRRVKEIMENNHGAFKKVTTPVDVAIARKSWSRKKEIDVRCDAFNYQRAESTLAIV